MSSFSIGGNVFIRLCAASAVSFLSFCAVAAAQVPSTAEPGRIEERFKPPPIPKAEPEIQLPGPEAPLPPAKANAIHFKLNGVTIEGATAFSAADFAPLYQSQLGKDVTLAQVYELRDAITAKYRKAGFVLSQAIIPPQKISGGIVRIQVVEGYIDHVEFKGDARDSRGLLRDMAEKITETRPLNVKALERYVLLMSDVPGVAVRTVIEPAKGTPGAANLVVLLEHSTVSGSAALDNRGSLAIGPIEGQAGLDLNSVLGLDEQTSLLLATTGQPKELQYGQLSSIWLLDPEGLRFSAMGSYSDSKPGEAIAALDAIGHALTIHGVIDYPLIRSRSENLHVSGAFTYLNSATDLLGTRFSDDRVRYLSLSASYDAADTVLGDAFPASNIVNAELSQGLDLFDASEAGAPDLSRANGHSTFTRFYAEATRIQSLSERTSLALSLSGQVAGSSLLTPVQFGLGGSRFGRGYEPSELTGDDGIAGSVEGRYDLPFTSEIIGQPQLYAFYDIGQVWNIDAPPGSLASASLASVGGGIRFTFLRHFAIDFELAKPLTRQIASRENKNIRPLFNISTRF